MAPKIFSVVDEGLGHSSYLIDLGDGTAALIDPPRFPTALETLATDANLRIAWTIDTHSHADYVTGSPGVVVRDGATFLAPAASRLETAHRPVSDGERITLSASVALVAIATPGHTPDHYAYALDADGRPVGVFTGGSLMVGTVGRTDLCGPELAEPLAHEMFRSLHRFDGLPDDLPVYPTHGAGSFCSAPGAAERTSTLGLERATNPLLQVSGEDEFVGRLLAGFGTFPTYFARLPELNRHGPSRYDTLPTLARLDADTVERQAAAGARIVDVRPFAAFGEGHIPGSLSNALRPVFASWLGWLVDPDRPVVFVLDSSQDRAEVVRQCLDIGHEQILGELGGGIDAWVASCRPLAHIPVVDATRLAPTVLDVRQHNEYVAGHIPAARNIELGALPRTSVSNEPVTVMCGHGERAMTAASLLAAAGHRDMSVLDGGPDTWSTATGRPLAVGP
jgi:glyoxylase-like metal-dependent hydrolase (beta-lactamase superfamily II)/rhodanese-related sulfurtransferase